MRPFGLGPAELIICGCMVLPLFAGVAVVALLASNRRAPQGPSSPAAWLPDPTGRHQFRYWDGTGWTAAASDNGQQVHDPM